MSTIQNFLLSSRADTYSLTELSADLLLTPARVLFGGKHVTVLLGSMHIADQQTAPAGSGPLVKSALKVAACITLPLALLGALIKLVCLRDANYRAFCAQKIPAHSTCHPKLFEIWQHVHSTYNFVTEGPPDSGSNVFKPLDLSECCCPGTGAFNRLYSNRRDYLEDAIVHRLKKTQADKSQLLSLLSIGSGGLMSDFLILEKLVLAGFKNISIDCVDLSIDPDKVERIRKFFADYPDVSIQIQTYKKMDEIPADRPGYSALLAVDYDTLTSFDFDRKLLGTGDLMKAHRRLNANGFMGLGFMNEDTLSGPHTPLTYVRSHSSLLFNLIEDLTLQLPQKDQLTIGISRLHLAQISHLFLFDLAMAAEKSGKNYQKISISPLVQPHQDQKQHFEALMQSLFPNAAIEISFPREENKKYDVFFTGTPEDEFRSKEYLSFLSPEALTYILDLEGGIQRQNNTREDQRVWVKPPRPWLDISSLLPAL